MFANAKRVTFSSLATGLLTLGAFFFSQAQGDQYRIDFTQSDQFTITGTSTLTDWTVTCNKIGGEPADLSGFGPTGGSVETFYFFASVDDMDGGRGETMNDKIKKALKSDQYPNVEYRQTEAARISSSDGQFKVVSVGNILLSGLTKPIRLELTGHTQPNGEIILAGRQPLTFSEFDIEPPSALFGQIVCGDEIQVNVSLTLKPVAQN